MTTLNKIIHLARVSDECLQIDLEIIFDNRCVWLENITNRTDVKDDIKCQNVLITLTLSDFERGLENYTVSQKKEGDISYTYDDIPDGINKEIKKLTRGRR